MAGGKKVKLEYIADTNARKQSHKKRVNGIHKKMDILTTRCGIEACAIIYSDFNPEHPEVWATQSGVESLINKFRGYSQLEQTNKMLNQETHLKKRIKKGKEQLEKLRKENRRMEMSMVMDQYLTEGRILDDLCLVNLNDLACVVSERLEEVYERMKTLKNLPPEATNMASASNTQLVAAADGDEVANKEGGQDRGEGVLGLNVDDMAQDMSWCLNLIDDGVEDENQLQPSEDFNSLLK